jgi:PleD family two-component response regulator
MALSLGRQVPSAEGQLLDTPTVDALTRIASHRVFQDRLAHECERAYRFGDTFMLLILDLDNFRPINERHGHRVETASSSNSPASSGRNSARSIWSPVLAATSSP